MQKPILYYFCGYQSVSHHSPKFKYLERNLNQDYDILPLDYPDSYDPKVCLPYFLSQINTQLTFGFMGSSLGGFWALQLGNRFQKLAITLSPCCYPSMFAQQFPQQRELFADFKILENTILNSDLPRLAFLAKDDEVFDYQKTMQLLPVSTEIILYEQGKHILYSKLPQIKNKIQSFLRTQRVINFD